MLLERSRASLPRALERMGFLQAQYAPSMYIGLWTRVEGLERDAVTRALERRSVVQATLLRGTIHLLSKRDFRPAAAAIGGARREWAMRVHVNARDLDERRMRAAARRLERALAGGRTLRRTEIEELIGKDEGKLVGVYVDLVRVPPSGTWERRRADLFGLAAEWLGEGEEPAPSAAAEWLARRYLAAFGPATKENFADWAGLPPRAAGPVIERVGTRRFRGEDGVELLDLPRAPLPDPETPAPVRLLPTWDATLLAHARRTQILPEEHRSRIFNTKTPQSVGTFLVDGQVAGTWRPDGERIAAEPFGRLARAIRRELDGEAARLAGFCSPVRLPAS